MAYTHEALTALLTRNDAQRHARDTKAGRYSNPYAIAIELRAADDMRDEVAAGADPVATFADTFTPTRSNHKIARAMELPLDVQRGQWVRL